MTLIFSLTSRKLKWRKFWGTMGLENQRLKVMPRINVPVNTVRATPRMPLTLQGCPHSHPHLEFQCPSSNPLPPLEISHSWGYRPWPQYPVYLHSPTRKITLPAFSKNSMADPSPVAKSKLNVHKNHTEQVGPAHEWAGGDQTLMMGNQY